MASIKSRIADLERSATATVRRELSDAERAVRLVHILNHPELFPMHVSLRAFLKTPLPRRMQKHSFK